MSVRWIASGARVGFSIVAFALAAFVFVRAMEPHPAPQARVGAQRPAQPLVSPVRVPVRARMYYYVVASEEHAKQLRDERAAISDYYGAGPPGTPPVIVVVRTQEVFETLRDVLDQTAVAGGPPYALIDLR